MKFPLIEKLDIPLFPAQEIYSGVMLYATHLERVLEKATVVYGKNDILWAKYPNHEHIGITNHTALLINIKETKPEPTKLKIHIYKDDQGNFVSEVADEQVGHMGGYKYVTTKEVEI